MKRGTPDHPKTHRLARALEVGWVTAVGHLELLWHFTAKHAPRGNVGRFTDQEIAEAIGYAGTDWSEFVARFVRTGWIDENATHRLIVHDWHEHCEETVRKYLTYHKLSFLTGRRVSRRKSETLGESPASRVAIGRGNGSGEGQQAAALEGKVRKGMLVAMPEPFVLSDEMRAYAERVPGFEAAYEFGKFKDHHRAKGSKFSDWIAAWRNWVRKSVEIAEQQAARGGRP